MPAKPGIVEVDNRWVRPVDQHVARMQVGLDQAERASRLAIANECGVQPVPRNEAACRIRRGRIWHGPRTGPERFGPHQPIGVERVPPEPGGWRPAGRPVTHRRYDGANAREV